jgi:hypothetical protein
VKLPIVLAVQPSGLTHYDRNSIVPAMLRKFIAGSFVALWLVLVGIDFAGDVGLIDQYRGSETDRAVDSVLTDYGQATNISDDTPLVIRPIVAPPPGAFFSPSLIHSVSTECVKKANSLSREAIPIYKIHRVFLI